MLVWKLRFNLKMGQRNDTILLPLLWFVFFAQPVCVSPFEYSPFRYWFFSFSWQSCCIFFLIASKRRRRFHIPWKPSNLFFRPKWGTAFVDFNEYFSMRSMRTYVCVCVFVAKSHLISDNLLLLLPFLFQEFSLSACSTVDLKLCRFA